MIARCVKTEYTRNRVLMTKMFSKYLLAKDLHTPLYAHQGYEIEHSSNMRDNGSTTEI
jgi:hypothetical protein